MEQRGTKGDVQKRAGTPWCEEKQQGLPIADHPQLPEIFISVPFMITGILDLLLKLHWVLTC